MTKFKLLFTVVSVTLLLWVLTVAVLAQEEPPPPYAGLQNPFPWNDTSAQEAGKGLYQQSCLGCHGAQGKNIAGADFSTADFTQSLEERADLHFWILSEGRLDRGMPPFKSSLSEEQRWQVLTYLWSLGAAAPIEVAPPPTRPPVAGESGILLSASPEQAQSGQPLTLTAVLQDSQGKHIGNATVKFFIKVDFFTSGQMEIGEAVTDGQGVAVLEYTPRLTGDIQIIARYEAAETAIMLTLAEPDEPFYHHTEAGIKFPAPGVEVFIGPGTPLELGEGGEAPLTVFRPPSGVLSWLSPLLLTVMAIWVTYFYVIYQVFRIPIVTEIRDTNTRLVALVGMTIVVALGIMLVLILVTGPYSHLHLLGS